MSEANRPGPEKPVAVVAGPAKGELLPVLPLRDIVVFPHMIVPLFVGREKSVRALEAVMKDDKQILLVAQKNATQDDPSADDIYRVGTVSTILQLLKLPDGTVKVLVEGGRRAGITGFKETEAYFEAFVETDPRPGDGGQGAGGARPLGGLAVRAVHQAEQEDRAGSSGVAQSDRGAEQARRHRRQPSQPEDRREAGAARDSSRSSDRLERVFGHMESEIGVLQVEKRIRSRVKRQMEKTQREYYLNEQLKAIQKELGEGEEGKDETAELEAKIKKTRLSKEAREKAWRS